MPACSALQPARTQTHSQFQLGPPEQSQARCSALLWCLMPRYAVLCIQMLSALNPSSITTMDTPSTPLERVHHFWPENNPALPATAARQSGKWGQDPALTTKPQHGASEMLLSMERSPALAPKSGWHRLPACLPAAGSLTPVLHSRQTIPRRKGWEVTTGHPAAANRDVEPLEEQVFVGSMGCHGGCPFLIPANAWLLC